MMDSSSDEDDMASKKTVQDGSGTAGSQEENGGVSPRTLQAIQRALMEDNNVSEDLCKEVQTNQKKYVIVSSSDDDDDHHHQDQAACTMMDRSILSEAREGGGVSPQTLLAIQRALGEKEPFTGSKQVEHVGVVSSSEGEEMEEVVGARSKEFKAAAHAEEEECKEGAPETICDPESSFQQKGTMSINLTEEKERIEQITVKSKEEDSSSEGMYATVRPFFNHSRFFQGF